MCFFRPLDCTAHQLLSWRVETSRDPKPEWIVAIGASGDEGLINIKSLLQALGPNLRAIVMVVLHRSYERPSALGEVLRAASPMPVFVASDMERMEVGSCYIGKPAAHLTLLGRSTGLITGDASRLHRGRTVDLLFKSVAAQAGPCGIGVILSGSLDDGSRGVAAIHEAGGKTMVLLRAQQPRGMPENAISYDGPIDCIGSTATIADAIRSAVQG